MTYLSIIHPRQNSRSSSRGDKEGQLLFLVRLLDENTPPTQKTSSANTQTRVPHERSNGFSIKKLGAKPGARETDGIIKDGDKGGQKSRRSGSIRRSPDNFEFGI